MPCLGVAPARCGEPQQLAHPDGLAYRWPQSLFPQCAAERPFRGRPSGGVGRSFRNGSVAHRCVGVFVSLAIPTHAPAFRPSVGGASAAPVCSKRQRVGDGVQWHCAESIVPQVPTFLVPKYWGGNSGVRANFSPKCTSGRRHLPAYCIKREWFCSSVGPWPFYVIASALAVAKVG